MTEIKKSLYPTEDTTGRAERLRESVFLAACQRRKTPFTPVWLMRQAGRYQKSYREIRKKVSFLELCKNKELACEVTVTAWRQLQTDAAIIFSDLLLILEPLGFRLRYTQGEGPLVRGQMTGLRDVDGLPEIEPRESLSFVFDAIRLTRCHLNAKIPLLGFSGAPFTLASYILEGGSSKKFLKTKKFMKKDPGAWHALLQKISRGLAKYLNGQIAAGADAVQIFDSWAGCLTREEYKTYVLPHTRVLIREITLGIPVIHFATGSGSLLMDFCDTGAKILGIDHSIALDKARKMTGPDIAIQGNLDPAVLFEDWPTIRLGVRRILKQAGGQPGHIFNLGHGVLPTTPEGHATALVEYVHELSARMDAKP